MENVRIRTDKQYKSGMKLACNTYKYEVLSSVDLAWFLKEEKEKGYLTTLKIIGIS